MHVIFEMFSGCLSFHIENATVFSHLKIWVLIYKTLKIHTPFIKLINF